MYKKYNICVIFAYRKSRDITLTIIGPESCFPCRMRQMSAISAFFGVSERNAIDYRKNLLLLFDT